MGRFFILGMMCVAAGLQAADFRNVSWGASLDNVKEAEGQKPMEWSDTELLFNSNLGKQPVNIRYSFVDGKLSTARYEFTQQYRESERYVFAYEVLQTQLIRKYGQPASERVICEDSFYMDYPRRWGTGIVVGKLTKESNWNTPKMTVRHWMRALPGGNVGHVVEYAPLVAPTVEFDTTLVYNAL